MQSQSLLSSLKAKFWALVRLGLGGWEDLGTLLIATLSSSASCWLILVHAASMAVMYSQLGGCLGDTTKLGPLVKTDLWAWVKGLLDRLMTHFGLGSSEEDPWGSLLGVGGWLSSWGLVLPAWGYCCSLGKPGALHLDECLTACLPELLPACLSWGGYCLPGKDLPLQECWGWLHCLPGRKHCPQEGGKLPACLSELLPACLSWGVITCMGTCLTICLASC